MRQPKRIKGIYITSPKDCNSFLDAAVNGLTFCYPEAIMKYDGEWCYFYQIDKKKKLVKVFSCNPHFAWHNLNLRRIKNAKTSQV